MEDNNYIMTLHLGSADLLHVEWVQSSITSGICCSVVTSVCLVCMYLSSTTHVVEVLPCVALTLCRIGGTDKAHANSSET